jgi:hypothetical protein
MTHNTHNAHNATNNAVRPPLGMVLIYLIYYSLSLKSAMPLHPALQSEDHNTSLLGYHLHHLRTEAVCVLTAQCYQQYVTLRDGAEMTELNIAFLNRIGR